MESNPLTRYFSIKLEKLQTFAGLVEDTLMAEAEALDTRVAEHAAAVSEADRAELYNYYAEDYIELADELPTILRYSVLTSADTALEVYLNDTCETYAELHDLQVRLGDFRGAGIQRARRYLKRVAPMPFPDAGDVWAALVRLHELRNAIVHADGVVAASKEALMDWSSNRNGIRISEAGGVSLSQQFTNVALESYRAFGTAFDASCKELDLWRSISPPVEDA